MSAKYAMSVITDDHEGQANRAADRPVVLLTVSPVCKREREFDVQSLASDFKFRFRLKGL